MPKKENEGQTTNTPPHSGRPKKNTATEPVAKPKNMGETLVRLWGYLRSQKLSLIFVTLFTALSAVLTLMGPYLIGVAVDKYIIPRDYNGLIYLCLVLSAVYIGSSVFSWLQMHVMDGVSQHTVRDMRAELFRINQTWPISFFAKTTHGELISRTPNDIETVCNTLNQSWTQFINSVLTLVGVVIFMLVMNVWLTLVSMIIIPIVIYTAKTVAKFTRKFFRSQQKELGSLDGFIEETKIGRASWRECVDGE